MLRPAMTLVGLFSATRVPFDGRLGLLDHVVMEALALLFLPMMHLNFINY